MKKRLSYLIPFVIMNLVWGFSILVFTMCIRDGSIFQYTTLAYGYCVEPIFWLIPTVFLIVLRRKTQTESFSLPALILICVMPTLRLVTFALIVLALRFGTFERLLSSFIQLPMLVVNPMVHMLIQTVFMTNLWCGLFSRREDSRE